MLVNMQLSSLLARSRTVVKLKWRPREENTVADDITNSVFTQLDMEKKATMLNMMISRRRSYMHFGRSRQILMRHVCWRKHRFRRNQKRKEEGESIRHLGKCPIFLFVFRCGGCFNSTDLEAWWIAENFV